MNFIHPTFAALEEEYTLAAVKPEDVIELRRALLGSIH